MITNKILLIVVFLLLPHVLQSASSPAIWQGSSLYQTAIVSMVTTSSLKTQTSTITFANTWSSTPNMITGITKMASTPGDQIDFLFNLTSITVNSFVLKYIIGSNMVVSSINVMYAGIHPSQASKVGTYTWSPFSSVVNMASLNSSTGPRNATYMQNFTFWTGQVLNLSHTNKMLTWIQSMIMRRNGGNFNFRSVCNFINTNNYTVTVYINGTTTLHTLFFSRLIYDQTALQQTQLVFVDSGSASSVTNLADLAFTLDWRNNTNFFIGLTTFSYQASYCFDFTFQLATLTWSGGMIFNWLSFDYFNYRARTCPTGYPYFSLNTNLCYDTCPPGYYLNTTISVCSPCYYYCKTCISSSATACTSCYAAVGRIISSGTCICGAGTYDTLSLNPVCGICLSTCLTCSSGTTCLTCRASDFRQISANQCDCMTGYIDNGSTACTPCNATLVGCLSCSSTTECVNCDTVNKFQPSAKICICQAGHYLSSGICVSCASITGCLACSSPVTCSACNTAGQFILNGTVCSCNSGYYLSGLVCTPCTIVGCLTCNSSSICTSCDTTKFLQLSSNNCVCQYGYYLSGGDCLSCSAIMIGCVECYANYVCSTCLSHLIVSGNLCLCPTGYSQSGTNCIACNSSMTGCISCTNSTSCQSCNASANFQPNSSMLCVCKAGYYLSGTACFGCMIGCSICTSASSCITCNASAHFVLFGSICVCDTGYVLSGTICVLCSSVLQGCTQCSSTSACTTCNASDTHLSLSGSTCVCDTSYVFNTTTHQCEFCLTCCSYGTYSDMVNGGCMPCSTTYGPDCLGCDQNACLNCVVGMYPNGASCTYCNSSIPGCTSCSVSTACDTCDSAANFLQSGSTCICNTGYYLSGSSCAQCSAIGCLACSSLTTCTSCDTALHFIMSGVTCVCTDGFYLDLGTTCLSCSLIPGCNKCSDSNTCTECDMAAYLQLNSTGSGVNCDCMMGYYFDGMNCQQCMVGCSSCHSASACLVCDASMSFSSDGLGGCQCISGMYLDASNICTACSSGCIHCTAVACSQCNTSLHYTLSAGNCVCESGYFSAGLQCDPCSNINGCETCSSALSCIGCNATEHYAVSNGVCICVSGYYLDANQDCLTCSSAIAGCDVCTDASTCSSCNTAANWQLSGVTCICIGNYVPVAGSCVDCVAACTCSGYALDANGVCSPICGDGIMLSPQECDDGNIISGDGCSSSCGVEQNYNCTGSATSASICSYNKPLTIVLIDSWKDPTSNTVYFSFLITPAIPALNSLNFSTALSCNLPNSNFTYSYSNGNLLVQVNYNSTIQSVDANLTLSPSIQGAYFFATPDTVAPFTVNPNNNLAAVYYQQEAYEQVQTMQIVAYAVAGLGYAGFLGGMVVGRFISVEMIGVLQLAFVGLIVVDYLQPLLAAMTEIGFVNGVNTLFSDQRQMLLVKGDLTANSAPKSAVVLSYDAQMVYSLNYSILLLLFPPLTALILFIGSKICKTKQKMQRFIKLSWIALCDFGLSAVVFLTYHIVVSLLIWAIYSKSQGTLFPFSIADAVISFSITIALMVLFAKKPTHFGDFKTAFKSDSLSQSHYYLLIGSRFILSILLVVTNTTTASGFICSLIPLIGIVYLGIRRPYLQNYNNFRAIFNSSCEFVILAIYGYYRCLVSYKDSYTGVNAFLPYAVVVLLLLAIIANIAAMVKLVLDKRKKKQQAKGLTEKLFKAQQEQNKLFLAGIMKEMTIFTQRRGTQVRQIVQAQAFSPENLEMNKMDKQYSSQLSIKSINQQIRQKRIATTERKVVETKVFTQQEVEKVEEDFDAI